MKMKIAAALALMFAVSTANASVLTYDNFDYPDGSLVGNGGWVNHSGTLGDLLVTGGQALVQHGVPSEDANKPFMATAGVVYFGADITVIDPGSVIGGGDYEYFIHFSDGGTSNFRARVDIVNPTGAGDFSVGISTTGSTADATWGADLSFGTTYRLIVAYDQDFNTSQLWIDASLETDTSILGLDQPDPGLSVTAIALRQSDSSQNEGILVDNLVVGMTFDDVVNPVPEPATLALLGLGGIALIRRRR
ncbi:MAG: PEP-CTERM sorting domain-containing protein [Phycisphaerales bacterium]|nr:PEP-CTERM sorting domain-containing protein [Phycisphaerales bacterium]MCB9854902.1 PEP-CTERM sorting domain-containing protein [Phycisphaerales bacterium]MCB9864405.1 PEP-CTERM sorting domain-containing protein [Phycisphaerales bacterium]